ncbi:MAG TPA: hypothetical protein VMI32_17240 [Candidatus Solibacter sp.]|nr:hypothetical protein [Candidatus Solibacter sp.]
MENFHVLVMPAGQAERALSLPPSRDPEIVSEAVRACSACAGDYEDPDRTAPDPDEEDESQEEYAFE